MRKNFLTKLYKWHSKHARDLPWKLDRDPYKIWVSEIILQQTRVDQGTPYYLRFIKKFPTIQKLAQAKEEEVLLAWEGLGYYSRARNMHTTAQHILDHYNGVFPDTYNEILALKGIGPYTAAAISSFAFGLQHAVVDGNVIRVLSRIFALKIDVSTASNKKEFQTKADLLLDKTDPGAFNQAMMDFGALQCKSAAPNCPNCIMKTICQAYKEGLVAELPLKKKKIKKKNRYFLFLQVIYKDKTLIEKRGETDIWKGLYQFPLLELENKEKEEEEKQTRNWIEEYELRKHKIENDKSWSKHTLTHQLIHYKIVSIFANEQSKGRSKNQLWVPRQKLNNYAFPKIIRGYIDDAF